MYSLLRAQWVEGVVVCMGLGGEQGCLGRQARHRNGGIRLGNGRRHGAGLAWVAGAWVEGAREWAAGVRPCALYKPPAARSLHVHLPKHTPAYLAKA